MATPTRLLFRNAASQCSRMAIPRTTTHYFIPKTTMSSVTSKTPFLFARDEPVLLNTLDLPNKFIDTEPVMMDMVEDSSRAMTDFPSQVSEENIIQLPENESTSVVSESDSSTNGRYQPHEKRRRRKHGFLSRLVDRHGRNTLNRRKTKGRSRMVSI